MATSALRYHLSSGRGRVARATHTTCSSNSLASRSIAATESGSPPGEDEATRRAKGKKAKSTIQSKPLSPKPLRTLPSTLHSTTLSSVAAQSLSPSGLQAMPMMSSQLSAPAA